MVDGNAFLFAIERRRKELKQLSLRAKIEYMISDFRYDWKIRSYYKRSWIYKNPYRNFQLLFL